MKNRRLNRAAAFGLRSHLAVHVACLGALALARADYLPKIGPAPFRFEAPPRPATGFTLPPLAMSNTAQAQISETTTPPAPPAPWPEASGGGDDLWSSFWDALTRPAPSPPVVIAAPPTPAPSLSVDVGSERLTPQMLVRFFTPKASGTNRVDAAIVAPFSMFQPPIPASAPSSTATYTTP